MVEQVKSPASTAGKRRRQPPAHGYAAYSGGRCRCVEICRPAAKDYRRQQRAKRLAWLQANPDDTGHGSRAAYDCGCRCKACQEARWVAGVLTGEYGPDAMQKRSA